MEKSNVGRYKLVVIGGSAGSLDIMLRIAAAIPKDTTTSFIVVLHRKSGQQSILRELLSDKTGLPVKDVEDKEPILPGTVYVAPAGYHLLLENDHTFSLDVSEKVNYSRPSIDVTFESAASLYNNTLVGILLSGANADGAAGMKAIARHGGFTIVQLPSTAEVGYMPQQALNIMAPLKVLDGLKIGHFLHMLLSAGSHTVGHQ
jgi:two-component system chemotaxis response regulator CheB